MDNRFEMVKEFAINVQVLVDDDTRHDLTGDVRHNPGLCGIQAKSFVTHNLRNGLQERSDDVPITRKTKIVGITAVIRTQSVSECRQAAVQREGSFVG